MNLQEIETMLRDEKENRKNSFSRITGLNANQFRIIDDNFISVNCETLTEVKNVLTSLKPFKNGWKITDGVYITSLYYLSIQNDYYNRSFKIEFENASGCKFWVNIKFNNLPEEFINNHFTKGSRGLYDTETVYVNMPAHYKKFRDIRIESFSFKYAQVNFYGGNKVIKCEEGIKAILNDILN